MTAIEKTAYPRFKKAFSRAELVRLFELQPEEKTFVESTAKKRRRRLTLAVLLKCQQYLGYSPPMNTVPQQVQRYLVHQFGIEGKHTLLPDNAENKPTYSLMRQAIRDFLQIRPYSEGGEAAVRAQVEASAYTMSAPTDLINVAIEMLIQQRFELPAFSTLERLVNHVRTEVHESLFARSTADLSPAEIAQLESLLQVPEGAYMSSFTRLKQSPGPATLHQMRDWVARLAWLDSQGTPHLHLAPMAHTKIRQLAAEAESLELGDFKKTRHLPKRYTLLLCLLHQAQVRCRDQLAQMFLKRMAKTHAQAQEKFKALQEKGREIEERLMATAAHIAQQALLASDDATLGQYAREVLAAHGGAQQLLAQYQAVSTYHGKDYAPLLWKFHKSHRAALYRLLRMLNPQSTTQDPSLIQALRFLFEHQQVRRGFLPDDIELDFASQRWQAFVEGLHEGKRVLKHRELELCVFTYLARGLNCLDLFVPGAEDFADYRTQLLSLAQCRERLPAYSQERGFPLEAKAFVEQVRTQLAKVAREVDQTYPENTELTLDSDGKPHLKRLAAQPLPKGLEVFKEKLQARMPARHLLDILRDAHAWIPYTRHFDTASGADPKLREALSSYLLTVFAYGCNLGPHQAARHLEELVSARVLKRVNDQHISTEKLEKALCDLIDAYTQFELPRFWGSGAAAIADGTQIPLRENNLLGERHIRYGGYGGIAYQHIADTYVALFSHFIACGVWEAVYILDGLLKNRSQVQPNILYADTQGQNEPAFGLAYLLGIELMPRMRNIQDVTFYRPDKHTRYSHIDRLFSETVDWELLEKHWEDLMQVVLSIQAGKILPSMLLQKLGVQSRKSTLYKVFRELGRVTRTMFLLRYLQSQDLRAQIRAETVKVESFNAFCDWIAFGGEVLTSGDPVENEKRIKYMSLVANAIMLRNVVDLTEAINNMLQAGETVTASMVQRLSPYKTEHIRRFGHYILNLAQEPPPLNAEQFSLPSL